MSTVKLNSSVGFTQNNKKVRAMPSSNYEKLGSAFLFMDKIGKVTVQKYRDTKTGIVWFKK